ncbi:hypothetical protein [Streptomyces sp. NPDC097981]|uniref:hypothetical protein n=1 Tax=Streptomyces sp. NPDC097981 TaxID=3155428 RepID=UPI00331F1827
MPTKPLAEPLNRRLPFGDRLPDHRRPGRPGQPERHRLRDEVRHGFVHRVRRRTAAPGNLEATNLFGSAGGRRVTVSLQVSPGAARGGAGDRVLCRRSRTS